MPGMTEKLAKVIVRGENGELLHVLPRTTSNAVAHGEGTVASELQRQANYDVVKSYVEIEPHSTTETTTEYVEYNGSISPYSSGNWFYIRFGTSDATTNPPTYSVINNSNITSSIQNLTLMESNQEYTFNFTLNAVPEAIRISTDWYVTDKDGLTSNLEYCVYPDSAVSSNDAFGYEEWEGNDNDNGFIKSTFPIGVERTFRFNQMYVCNQENSICRIPFSDLGMAVSITNIDGTNYTLTFSWNYSETKEVVTTTNWKELKTTIERGDETTTVENKPISGFLQNVSFSKELSYAVEEITSTETYSPYVYIGDDSSSPQGPLS